MLAEFEHIPEGVRLITLEHHLDLFHGDPFTLSKRTDRLRRQIVAFLRAIKVRSSGDKSHTRTVG